MSTQQLGVAAGWTRTSSAIWRRWPAAVGLLGAAFVALVGPDRETLVISLLVALTCYLAAAAVKVRRVAWATIPIASALVTAGAFIGIDPLVDARWCLSCLDRRRSGAASVAHGPRRSVTCIGRVRRSGSRCADPGSGCRRRIGIAGSDGACGLGRHPLSPQCGGTALACRNVHLLRRPALCSRHRSPAYVNSNWARAGLVDGQMAVAW